MLTKQKIKEMRTEIQNVLDEYGEKKGIQIELGHIRFDDTSFTSKIKVIMAENNEKAEKIEWDKVCDLFNLKKEDYGKIVDLTGEKYKLVKIKPKSRKYPLVVEKMENGKRYKYKLNDYVREQIKKA